MSNPRVVLSGTVSRGKLRLSLPADAARELSRWKDGTPLTVSVEKKHATRSLQASAYYWGVVVARIAEHTGYTPDETHEALKQLHLPKTVAFADGNGEVVGELVIGGSTAKLNTVAFYEYVEQIRQWAQEKLGVLIEPPDPNWRQQEQRDDCVTGTERTGDGAPAA